MTDQLLASKNVVQEEERATPNITGVSTSVTGALGVAERGPVGVATLVRGIPAYERIFGGYVANGELRQFVDAFFAEGGTDLWVTRVVHNTDPTDPETATSIAAALTLMDGQSTPANTLHIEGTPGTYANDLAPRISAASSGKADRFNWATVKNGVILESFPNLSMDAADARYAPKVLNDAVTGSRYFTVTDVGTTGSPTQRRPANTGGTLAKLTGGADGLTGLVDADFIGGEGVNGKNGLRCFDKVQRLDVLAVPGRATPAVHNAMIQYCEVTRSLSTFPVLDPPANISTDEINTYVTTTATLLELSEFGAIYWPRLLVANPNTTVFGSDKTIAVAPSGLVCGRYARTDSARPGGVYDPPAGDLGALRTCLGVESEEVLEEEKRDIIYPNRINPISMSETGRYFIDGTRTLKSTGNFPSISERRGAIFIEQSIKRGLQFARHRRNTPALRASCDRITSAFLYLQLRQGAFRYDTPSQAYFVDFSDALNTASVQFAEKLVGRIGIATAKPAEFVITSFSQDTRALDAELAAA